MTKTTFTKNLPAVLLILSFFILTGTGITGPMGLPDKYSSLIGKKWVFTKCIYNNKDATDMVLKNNKGLVEYYIFKGDGTAETNLPNVISGTWKYEKDELFMVFKTKTDPNQPVVAGSDMLFSQYSIGEVSNTTLKLERKKMKLIIIYTAK